MEQDDIKATKAKDQAKGGAKGFTKSKDKGMNNFEHSQRRWQAPPFTPDVLLIERKTEPGRQGYKKEQLSHVKQKNSNKNEQRSESTVECVRQVGPAFNQGQQEESTSSESIRSFADGC